MTILDLDIEHKVNLFVLFKQDKHVTRKLHPWGLQRFIHLQVYESSNSSNYGHIETNKTNSQLTKITTLILHCIIKRNCSVTKRLH